MQDLEELKERLKNNNLRLAIDPAIFDVNQLEDLIARCERAEKALKRSQMQQITEFGEFQTALENVARLESELKELREQKPIAFGWSIGDGNLSGAIYQSRESAIDMNGPFIIGYPFPLFGQPMASVPLKLNGAQSRDSAEPDSNLTEAMGIVTCVAHIGVDFGFGEYHIEQSTIDKARKLVAQDEGKV